ncbi:hypothetical protein TBLA_0E01110 [Henningerozyma blattae CBS 6284]|uniref:Zn(2)-C6 fungal-type domain-containing protein n=1 Tax=Henningerozyma blattae (strain ATCC 34711 / CBS 6284 / DSM 70876 / NBRC 10599 / NRRL Y-10934 / UCD 77-7) TaxID=1071380 RepID=I2H469_HENB6|nr:hypothetical protein TBLA_0E01110 [Tetrapisispora blattae CBS 6284]CCH61171.1 hypothetical protein TBLA_0E01110 [Tetrapisispora blattae CBS 6284]
MGRPKKDVSEKKLELFQLELERAGNNASQLIQDKRGRSRSCLLCRRRKQKCDHKLPSCTACLKAAVKCIQPTNYRAPSVNLSNSPVGSGTIDISGGGMPMPSGVPSGMPSGMPIGKSPPLNPGHVQKPNEDDKKNDYTKLLERKLKYLEKLIDLNPSGVTYKKKKENYKKITQFLGAIPPIEPHGSGSDTRRKNVKYSIPMLASDSLDSIDFSKCIFGKYNLKEFMMYDPAFEFNERLSRTFLDIFFNKIQFKYPLLNEAEIYAFHENYIRDDIYGYSEKSFHFNCGRVWMVYCISSCLCSPQGNGNSAANSETHEGYPSVRYFSTAVRHITKCGDQLGNMEKIELLTLLVLYLLRTDRDSIVLYEIIVDVMAIVKDVLGLNRGGYDEEHKRVFWCVYLLERMICVAVGKEYTIQEREVNVALMTDTHRYKFLNENIRLFRIESRFVTELKLLPQNKIHRSNESRTKHELQIVERYYKELEQWQLDEESIKNELNKYENEALKLNYYQSVRLLIEPYLEVLNTESKLFRECQSSAGRICQIYKNLNQRSKNGHSTPSVHTVFIAGVTLIYCMWLSRNQDDKRRRKLGDSSKHTRPLVSGSLFSNLDDLRACSICLYVMTERSGFARLFRDTFDQLMNATVGNLIERCGPDSSELIYISKKRHGKHHTDAGRQQRNRMLEGNPIPKSLSHLLIQEDKKEAEAQAEAEAEAQAQAQAQPNGDQDYPATTHAVSTPSSTGTGDLPLRSTQPAVAPAESATPTLSATAPLQVVKKPANSREFFDWETFQQQAFLQQQQAQQNLQIYLSTLNRELPAAGTPGLAAANTQMFEPESLAKDLQVQAQAQAQAQAQMQLQLQLQHRDTAAATLPGSQSSGQPVQTGFGLAIPAQTPTGAAPHAAHYAPHESVTDMITNISTWTNDSVTGFAQQCRKRQRRGVVDLAFFRLRRGVADGETRTRACVRRLCGSARLRLICGIIWALSPGSRGDSHVSFGFLLWCLSCLVFAFAVAFVVLWPLFRRCRCRFGRGVASSVACRRGIYSGCWRVFETKDCRLVVCLFACLLVCLLLLARLSCCLVA